jgi:hypothetical protein
MPQRVALQVFLDGLRDKTHQYDDVYDDVRSALDFVPEALAEPAVSEVRLVKLPDS